MATKSKFSQYPELKSLLLQTGLDILVDTVSDDDVMHLGIGFETQEDLKQWMMVEKISVADLAFWSFHGDFAPRAAQKNLNGKLLMHMRRKLLESIGFEFKASLVVSESKSKLTLL